MLKSSNLDIFKISEESGGYISANSIVFNNIPINPNSKEILRESITGTPLIRLGKNSSNISPMDDTYFTNDSNGKKVMIIAGVHGNELPPQIAAIHLIHRLKNIKLNGEIYIIPFSAPKSTMNNSRWFDGADLNRIASKQGSITNNILNMAKKLNVDSIGDFHSTGPNSMPGKEAIFCTKDPSPESYDIAKYIAKAIDSEILFYPIAGQDFQGTIEDECNLIGIPAVTCEVFCQNGYADKKSYTRSLEQMLSYLSYFGIISDEF